MIHANSIRTRYPVVLDQQHSSSSPTKEFSVLLSSDQDPSNPPVTSKLFQIHNGTVRIDGPGTFGYMFGVQPAVDTKNTDVSSDMTIAIVLVRETYERIYLLEGGPVHVMPKNGNGETATLKDAFSYVQIEVGANGNQWNHDGAKAMPKQGDPDPDQVRDFAVFAVGIAANESADVVVIP